jgi:vacuolar iron transporter family protein
MSELREIICKDIREIVFGAEDGVVSTFGLVFGLAAAAEGAYVVLLAGVTGALSGAVSMGAGAFLSVQSERDVAERELAEEAEQIQTDPETKREEIAKFLLNHGFNKPDVDRFLDAAQHKPDFILDFMAAHELQVGKAIDGHPLRSAIWMAVAYTLAAAFPVLPYALFPLETGRLVSLVATVVALVVIGLGRAAVSHRQAHSTVVETIAIAALAAGAGFVASTLVTRIAGVNI